MPDHVFVASVLAIVRHNDALVHRNHECVTSGTGTFLRRVEDKRLGGEVVNAAVFA